MNSVVFWITGLSAAGKTTLGEELANRLRKMKESVIFLDGNSYHIESRMMSISDIFMLFPTGDAK